MEPVALKNDLISLKMKPIIDKRGYLQNKIIYIICHFFPQLASLSAPVVIGSLYLSTILDKLKWKTRSDDP